MKILFMGTPEFAATSLQSLLAADAGVIGVVTQPDKPRRRGMELLPSEVKEVALAAGLPVWQPKKVSSPEFLEIFREIAPELVVVVAFGQKIPVEVLFEPKYGCINVHGSLLPQYRGAAPIQWSLLNGDTVTGVTTMYMDEGWDTGDMIFKEETFIDPKENLAMLYSRLAKLGGDLLVRTVTAIERGEAPRIPQEHHLATLAPKIRTEQEKIVWEKSAQTIHNQVRAFAPQPGAETTLGSERIKLIETEVFAVESDLPPGTPGEILKVVKNRGILTATGKGVLLITQVQPAGKKAMPAFSFANGRRLEAGMRFGG